MNKTFQKAPETSMRWDDNENGKTYSNYTFAYAIAHFLVSKIANRFKFGFEHSYFDPNDRKHLFMNNSQNKGLYSNLPQK